MTACPIAKHSIFYLAGASGCCQHFVENITIRLYLTATLIRLPIRAGESHLFVLWKPVWAPTIDALE